MQVKVLPETDEQAKHYPAALLKKPLAVQAPVQAVPKLPQAVQTLFNIPYPEAQLIVPAPATQADEVELQAAHNPAPLTK